MARKIAFMTFFVVFLLSGVLATNAYAGLGPPCDTIDSSFNAKVSPDTGAAGDQLTVSVSGAMGDTPVMVYWEEESNQIAFFNTDSSGNGSAVGNIPADALPGTYHLRYAAVDDSEHEINCYLLVTVVSGTQILMETPAATTVQQNAYTAAAITRSSLPSTGIFLLPAAGLLAAGAGLMLRRRRSS